MLMLNNRNIKILILDNLSCLTPGLNENEKDQWDEINQWLLKLRFLGVAVIMVHHAGKSGDQRGTSGREDNIDVSIHLKHPQDYKPSDGAVFDVEFKKSRGVCGDGVSPFTFRIQKIDGHLEWTTDKVGTKIKDIIIALIGNPDKNIKQSNIVRSVGKDKSYVSRIINIAIKDGILTEDKKFTPSGLEQYKNIDIEQYLLTC